MKRAQGVAWQLPEKQSVKHSEESVLTQSQWSLGRDLIIQHTEKTWTYLPIIS